MPEPVLSVSGASYRYGAMQALDQVDLSVGAGEIYTLLGPNGAGKTTLVRAISSRIVPQDGSIRVAGETVGHRQRRKPSLGIVPQQIALYPHLTARENLITFARLMKVAGKEARQRADQFLERVKLADRASSPIATLSGGMQRRINIGAALMHRPALLVLDEPTVGVDIHARESIHDLLGELRAEGLAILLTTHDMDQAAQLSDRVGIIHAGQIVIEGQPDQLIESVFGSGMELVVSLSNPPDSAQRARLEELSLKPIRGDLVWSGPAADSFDAAAPQLQAIADAGLALQSVNLNKPTLGSVFFHVVGRELDG